MKPKTMVLIPEILKYFPQIQDFSFIQIFPFWFDYYIYKCVSICCPRLAHEPPLSGVEVAILSLCQGFHSMVA